MYRSTVTINHDWVFTSADGVTMHVDVPHTWNASDGQDGGDDYYRGTCHYRKLFDIPAFNRDTQCVYIEFCGVNASADVILNGHHIVHHDGGYSTFRADITNALEAHNVLDVAVDNGVNNHVYPQKADFTFYGGIYRDVRLLIVPQMHIDVDYYGGYGVKITPSVHGKNASVRVQTWHNATQLPHSVQVRINDANGITVAHGTGDDVSIMIPHVHLWDGIDDPYLYTAQVSLVCNNTVVDEVMLPFGVRTFHIDPQHGFFLNGRHYPLHAVTRHQDRKNVGNAITEREHDEDIALIREMGANAIRLAHYQHDQHIYDLCDQYGLIVWAEIPYISQHMPEGRTNTISQMTELIVQNHHHPSIVTWGLSNEITITPTSKHDMLSNHRELNQLCHHLDSTRPTTMACYAMSLPFNKVSHIADLVGWNLYLGWYVPGLFLNDLWISAFRLLFPHRRLGYSEYGCEGMINLHSSHPRRGDYTEEYQCRYHEFMLKCFERHPNLWIVSVWTMFDFASDARNEGGEPGINHKGLVSFDRQVKKDSFYLYKAYWSTEPFVHICGRRYVNRAERVTTVKVYSNLPHVELYANGVKINASTKHTSSKHTNTRSSKIFRFRVPLHGEVTLEAVAGDCRDTCTVRAVTTPDSTYRLHNGHSSARNWT